MVVDNEYAYTSGGENKYFKIRLSDATLAGSFDSPAAANSPV